MSSALLRSVLACAAGSKVQVVLGSRVYELPLKPEPVVPPPPDPVELLAQRMAERNELELVARSMAEARAREEAEKIQTLLQQAIQGQEKIVEALFLPVVPTAYDKNGRIISAQRKKV